MEQATLKRAQRFEAASVNTEAKCASPKNVASLGSIACAACPMRAFCEQKPVVEMDYASDGGGDSRSPRDKLFDDKVDSVFAQPKTIYETWSITSNKPKSSKPKPAEPSKAKKPERPPESPRSPKPIQPKKQTRPTTTAKTSVPKKAVPAPAPERLKPPREEPKIGAVTQLILGRHAYKLAA